MQPDISIMRAHSSMASGSCIIRTPQQQTHANLSRNSAPPVMPVFSSHPSSNIADQFAMSNHRLVLNETTRIDTDSEGDDTNNSNHQVADEIDGGEEKIEGNTEIRRLLERRSQREQEQRKRRKSTGSITSETLIARKYRGDDDHLEIFDPSLIFISTFKCYYWDSKDRIRKGKVYITSRELMFKCSGMPFVKVRLDLSDITDVVKIKNYKHKLQNVLSIETNSSSSSSSNTSTSKSFVFYKFRLPRNLVRSIIMQLVAQAKVAREQEEMLTGSQSDAESINSHILRLKKMSQPLNHFASLIRTSLNGSSSATTTSTTTPKSSHNPSEDENGSESTMLNREAKTASSSTTLSTSEASTLQDEIDNNTKRTKKTLSFKSKKQRNSLKREYSRNDNTNTNTNTNKTTGSQEPVSNNGERNEQRVTSTPMPFQDSCTTMHHKLTNENNSSIQLEYNKTVKNSTATVLLLMFLSLLIFFVIAINNFIKLSTIERQIYHSLKWDGDAVLPGYL